MGRLLLLALLFALPAAAQPAALLRAARTGNAVDVRAALARGADPNAADSAGSSALMLAAHGGHLAALDALLDAGADCARRAAYPLDSTAFYGSLLVAAAGEGHVAVLDRLATRCRLPLDAPEVSPTDGTPGWTPLQTAAYYNRTGAVRWLLDHHARLDLRTEALTALDYAVNGAADSAAVLLLARDAPSARAPAEVLRLAAAAGLTATLGVLLAHTPDFRPDSSGTTALMVAARNGHLGALDLLAAAGAPLHAVDADGWTALHWAAAFGQGAAAARLLALGLSRDARDTEGDTPLALALLRGMAESTDALIAAGADPATRARDGWTGFHVAARDARPALLDTLLRRAPALLDLRTDDGWTALALAAHNGNAFAAARLLCAGADTTLANAEHLRPYALAVRHGHALTLAVASVPTCADRLRLLAADSASSVARSAFTAGHFADAVRARREAYRTYRAVLGFHPLTFSEGLLLGNALRHNAQTAETAALLDTLDAELPRFEPSSSDRRSLRNNRASALLDLSRLDEAISLQMSVVAEEDTLRLDAEDRAQSISNLGTMFFTAGRLPEAERAFRRADTLLAGLSPTLAARSDLALNLAVVLRGLGQGVEARRMMAAQVAQVRQAYPPDHPEIASALSIYGDFLEGAGDYGEAERLYVEALDMRTRAFGPDHGALAASLDDLGALYVRQNQLARARPYLERAFELALRTYAAASSEVALAQSLLANLYLRLGDHAAAEALRQRLLDRSEQVFGATSIRTADELVAMGRVSADALRTDEARGLFERALGIYTAAHPPNHPDVLSVRMNLAGLDFDARRFAEAIAAYTALLPLLRADSAASGLELSTLYNNLAASYWMQDDNRAAGMLERSIVVRRRLLGDLDPSMIVNYRNAAMLYGRTDPHKARSFARASGGLTTLLLRETLPSLAMAEQQRFLQGELPLQTSLLLGQFADVPNAGQAYTMLARWKGLLLRTLGEQARLSRLPFPEATALTTTRQHLAALLQHPPAADSSAGAAWKAKLQSLTDEKERLERALRSRQAPAADPLDSLEAGGLRALLRPGEAFVDFYRYAHGRDDYRYAVVVFSPRAAPSIRLLGDATRLDGLIDRWRDAVLRGDDADDARTALVRHLWKPLLPLLPAGTHAVWISPDAQLARVPFEVLVGEGVRVSQVDSPRAFAALRRRPLPAPADGLLAVGDVAFGAAPDARFEPLPGTGAEVRALTALAGPTRPATTLTGEARHPGARDRGPRRGRMGAPGHPRLFLPDRSGRLRAHAGRDALCAPRGRAGGAQPAAGIGAGPGRGQPRQRARHGRGTRRPRPVADAARGAVGVRDRARARDHRAGRAGPAGEPGRRRRTRGRDEPLVGAGRKHGAPHGGLLPGPLAAAPRRGRRPARGAGRGAHALSRTGSLGGLDCGRRGVVTNGRWSMRNCQLSMGCRAAPNPVAH